MATETIEPRESAVASHERAFGMGDAQFSVSELLRLGLSALASLRLTVVLFGLAIFLIFAGTLAQVEKDIWQVVDEYFRSWIAWIDLQVFFPPAFFPSKPQVPGMILFPGGKLIGVVMALNLLAAHTVRFTSPARGKRLVIGLAVVALGLAMFGLAVSSGVSNEGILEASLLSMDWLWKIFVATLVLVWTALGYACLTLPAARRLERILLGATTLILGVITWWLVLRGGGGRLDDSGMRILWQLMKAEGVALVLLCGCLMLFKKRAGIVLLHGGIGLMMLGELLVAQQAVEGQMMLFEGDTSNFVTDTRTVEIALTDRSSPKFDTVISIPKSRFARKGAAISDERLPFDLEVVEYMDNSEVRRRKESDQGIAAIGLGAEWIAEPRAGVTGTDTNAGINLPAAYVRFKDKRDGRVLGVHLLSSDLSMRGITESARTADRPYEVELRLKRTPKPYSITLLDVRKTDYVGTNTPRDYSSNVYVFDPTRDVDREVRIWMNNPLRFAGETFYQSGYNEINGRELSTLQVVSNSSWMIPYVGCMVVATGLLAQFLTTLWRFLGRFDRQQAAAAMAGIVTSHQPTARRRFRPTAADAAKTSLVRWDRSGGLLWTVVPVLIATLVVGSGFARQPSSHRGMDLASLGKLPVAQQGRVKPLDTVARNSLRILSTYAQFKDEQGVRQPAIRWLADLIARPEEAARHRVIKIVDADLVDMLGAKPRTNHLYSVSDIAGGIQKLDEQAMQARDADGQKLSNYERRVVALHDKVGLIYMLSFSLRPVAIRDDTDEHQREDLMVALRQTQDTERMMPPLIVPPIDGSSAWTTYATESLKAWARQMTEAHGDAAFRPNPAYEQLRRIFAAYSAGNEKEFNRALATYHSEWFAAPPHEVSPARVDFETLFNSAEMFFGCSLLYGLGFLMVLIGWIGWHPQLSWLRSVQRAAFWLLLTTWGFHTAALVARIYISQYAPVTNLYSSAVFIGWGCVTLALVIEALFHVGVGNLAASTAGFLTLLIAHFLSLDGDTIGVMQAVLDTQFWLATHVVTVTLGYATTYLAGLLGIAFIVMGVATPVLNVDMRKLLASIIYGVLCFAIFFSFVGTVLGGLWADDSWGRFWGWDVKENGALIIVLWNALVLHARWGKMVGDRGLAALAVAGCITTTWSWFGVNLLNTGLHTYGFTENGAFWFGIAVAVEGGLLALGLLPRRWWMSNRGDRAQPVVATLVS